ncbi:MAG TPA: HAMP domain-containing sensor histidine kinase [Anaerolineales bacterium]|nr:HAMP domain-containing sensor histidine kinase [Anaerolineales bacterium]
MQTKFSFIQLSAASRFILALLIILTLSVIGFYLVFNPPMDEVWLITGFLLITTIISAIAGYAAYRLGWMNRSPNIRTALLGSYALACLLTFINVWLTARLMFADQHDLLLGTVLLIFAGAIAMALGYLLSSSFRDRIRSIDEAAKKIASGNLSSRVPIEGRDELADLAQTFNHMASQLEEAAEQRKELETLRKELIAWIGHDLQTPLTSISAIIEALADGMVQDQETEHRYFETAKKNISALSHLIDDMFQMAQIDAGGLELNYESVSISDLISDCLESYTEIAKRKEIILRGRVSPDIGEVEIDARRINRVLTNLIDNTLHHTQDRGLVEVIASQTIQEIIVIVEDNGVGISTTDLPHIFEQFYRGNSSQPSVKRRTGLGLAISKGIIDAHGGEISVTSQPGHTRFTFTIPCKPQR